jgi:hypothetical protein
MPDAAKKQVDILIGRSLITVEALAAEVRSRLIRRLMRTKRRFFASQYDLLAEARSVLSEFEPILAQTIADVELAAWIAGTQAVAGRIQLSRQAQFIPDFGQPPRKPPSLGALLGGGEEYEPIIRFPLIENAAKSLAERNIVTPREFAETAAEVKRQAFTVAGQASEQAIEKIRDALVETIEEGPSLKIFREKVEQAVEAGGIGPGHMENVFRTNVQTAFHQGYDEILQHPIVSELFPYQSYVAIHDGRVRDDHLALEILGIDGTNIFRRDDPFWDLFTPPWSFQCRCTIIALTIEASARKGVKEAAEWLRTGVKPPLESRLPYIPFRPAEGWGRRPRIAA